MSAVCLRKHFKGEKLVFLWEHITDWHGAGDTLMGFLLTGQSLHFRTILPKSSYFIQGGTVKKFKRNFIYNIQGLISYCFPSLVLFIESHIFNQNRAWFPIFFVIKNSFKNSLFWSQSKLRIFTENFSGIFASLCVSKHHAPYNFSIIHFLSGKLNIT